MPGADVGLDPADPTIAELLKPLGYSTGQFGKNHLGDSDESLPSNHGFDEFFGNLYHLNAEDEPEHPDYPKDPAFREKFGPRGVIHSYADGRIEDTGRDWVVEHLFVLYPVQSLAAEQLQSFGEFPPRQDPAAFNLDSVMKAVADAGGSGLR
jgi:arylsulfatase A-like enzyme